MTCLENIKECMTNDGVKRMIKTNGLNSSPPICFHQNLSYTSLVTKIKDNIFLIWDCYNLLIELINKDVE